MGTHQTVRRMLQEIPSKCFKEVKHLVGRIWPIGVLQKHYLFRELSSTFALDDLFEFDQRVSMHLSNSCNEIVALLIITCACSGRGKSF